MLSALYYPHTEIRDINLIKNALLLWDQVEYITPRAKWKHEPSNVKLHNEAIEIVTRPHCPDKKERTLVHKRVEALVQRGLPDWFFLDRATPQPFQGTYPIYPKKMADETWHLLESNHLARFEKSDDDYHVSPALGLMVMSLLADACAGATKQKITDRVDAYAWLAKYATAELGGEYVVGLDASQVAPAYERLVTISIRVLDTDDIPISKLVAMRKREMSEPGHDYRGFRLKYLQKVNEYVEQLCKKDLTDGDVKELERQFEKDMESDIANLRKELGVARKKLVLSKEVAVAAIAIGGALAHPIAAITGASPVLTSIGIGALVKNAVEYKAARRKAMKDSAMSWLYLSKRRFLR